MVRIIEEQSGRVVRTVRSIAAADAVIDSLNETASWARTGKTYDMQVA